MFVARIPDKFELIDGHEHIDPNDEDRIMLEGRDGAWFKASWKSYLRPKYRKTLARWWSDTGGGGGQLENFQNYCPFRKKWLTYVYMLDFEASLLLASNASLAIPKELLNESGYHHQEATNNGTSKASFAKLNSAALIQATEDCTNNINKVATLMATLVEKRLSPAASNVVMSTPTTMSSTPPPTKKRSFVECLDDVRRLREHEQQITDNLGVSPATKQVILNRIQKEKKKVIVNAAATEDEDNE